MRQSFTKAAFVLFAIVLLTASCIGGSTTQSTADDPGAVTPIPTATDVPAAGDPDSGPADVPDEDPVEPDADTDDPAFNDPTAGPDRAPDEPRIVPPLELPATAPGTDAAAAALLEDLERFITTDQLADGVPWPDLRNPDPIASYQSDARFQNWMAANNPTPTLVEAYTAPGSPERSFDLELFGFRNSLELRAGPATPPYSMRVIELVHPAATGITDALLAQVPEGSAAVVYFDSMGSSDTFNADGQYLNSNAGWTEVGPWVAIMAPTDVGWQVWWDELTDPPPPGAREQRGTPQDETPRRDV